MLLVEQNGYGNLLSPASSSSLSPCRGPNPPSTPRKSTGRFTKLTPGSTASARIPLSPLSPQQVNALQINSMPPPPNRPVFVQRRLADSLQVVGQAHPAKRQRTFAQLTPMSTIPEASPASGGCGCGDGTVTCMCVPNEIFEGTVYKGERQGQGKLKTLDGIYEGGWYNHQKSGNGTYYYLDRSNPQLKPDTWRMYQGEWEDDLYHGKGVFISRGDMVLIRGEWDKGVLQEGHEKIPLTLTHFDWDINDLLSLKT